MTGTRIEQIDLWSPSVPLGGIEQLVGQTYQSVATPDRLEPPSRNGGVAEPHAMKDHGEVGLRVFGE
jgi:hypothetical protein